MLISFDATAVDPRHRDWLRSVEERVGLGELSPQPYWGFDDLFHTAGTKLLNCFYVQAECKRVGGKEFFHFCRLTILQQLSFDNFLRALEDTYLLIDFDARSGHNHGTKFRLRRDKWPALYSSVIDATDPHFDLSTLESPALPRPLPKSDEAPPPTKWAQDKLL